MAEARRRGNTVRMALETLLATSLEPPAADQPSRRALVLMGGGARTAYQVGVLRALARMLGEDAPFPFHIVLGTSAGALNAAYLGSRAGDGCSAFDQLAAFWSRLRSHQVYRLSAWLPYRPVEVLALQPSASLDELALKHVQELPAGTRDTLAGLGALETRRHGAGSAAALASYLLFEPGFVHALMRLGDIDAQQREGELRAFFGAAQHDDAPVAVR